MELTAIQITEFTLNVFWVVVSFLILITFLRRFEGNVNYRKPNILGVILMVLGLTLHIIGNLIIQTISNQEELYDLLSHGLASVLSLSITMFIAGSFLLLYHITNDNKAIVKYVGYVYLVFGIVDTLYHLIFYFDDSLIDRLLNIELIFKVIEMATLIVIYVFLFLQANRSVNKIISNRYQLLSITALGFVLIILVDGLIALGTITLDSGLIFFLFFILHLFNVGALYLLVLFPKWYQRALNITQE